MKRLDFLKYVGIGAAAVVVAPTALASVIDEVQKPVDPKDLIIEYHKTGNLAYRGKKANFMMLDEVGKWPQDTEMMAQRRKFEQYMERKLLLGEL